MKKKNAREAMYVCSNFITLLLFAFISVATGSFQPGRGHRFRVHANLSVRGSFASRQDGFAYFRRRFGIFCRRGSAHFDDGFFLRRVGGVARMHPSCHRARFLAVLLSTFGLTVIPSFAVDGGKRWDFL